MKMHCVTFTLISGPVRRFKVRISFTFFYGLTLHHVLNKDRATNQCNCFAITGIKVMSCNIANAVSIYAACKLNFYNFQFLFYYAPYFFISSRFSNQQRICELVQSFLVKSERSQTLTPRRISTDLSSDGSSSSYSSMDRVSPTGEDLNCVRLNNVYGSKSYMKLGHGNSNFIIPIYYSGCVTTSVSIRRNLDQGGGPQLRKKKLHIEIQFKYQFIFSNKVYTRK